MRSQRGGAILIALMVILTGAILLSMWMKTRPSYSEAYQYFDFYQGRVIAEGALDEASPMSFLDSLGFEIQKSQSSLFYDEIEIIRSREGQRIGRLEAASLEKVNSKFADVSLRLLSREPLRGDHRQIHGVIESASPEDVESGLAPLEFSDEDLKLILAQLEAHWNLSVGITTSEASQSPDSDVADFLSEIGEPEFISGPRVIRDTSIITNSKITLDDSVQMIHVDLITTQGIELRNGSRFEGRILSRGQVELSLGSSLQGWVGLLPTKDSTQTPQLKVWDAQVRAWVFALAGGIREDDFYSVEMDESSEVEALILTPYKVQMSNAMKGHLTAYSIHCGTGTNCLGSFQITENLSESLRANSSGSGSEIWGVGWKQPTWMGVDSKASSWKMRRWTR